MPDQSATFEAKIARLEAIVKELETGNIELDKAVSLFKEGKALAQECEGRLKGAQANIERLMEQPSTSSHGDSDSDEIPF